jgi:hypothetical protein
VIRRAITCLVLATALTGCFGHNALTRRVLKFNLTTAETRWPREFLFVGMWIIPVYPITAIVDILVLNSIEFWSGENPISGKRAVVDVPKEELERLGIDAIDVAQAERLDDTHANLYVQFVDGDRVTFDILRDGDQVIVSYQGVEFYRGEIKL